MQERWWDKENRVLIGRYYRVFSPFRKSNRKYVYPAALGMGVKTLVSLVLPWITMMGVDHIINTKEISKLYWLLSAWGGAIVIRGLGDYLSFYNLLIFRQRIQVQGRMKLLKHILRLPLGYFSEKNVGYVVCRVRDDVGGLEPFWAQTLLTTIQSFAFIVVSMILLLKISAHLSLLILILAPLYLFNSFLFMKRTRTLSYEMRELSGKAEGKLHEAISGITTVKTLGLEHFVAGKYLSRLTKTIRTSVRLEFIMHIRNNLGGMLRAFVPIVVFCYAGYLIYRQELSVGEFIGFSAYVSFLLDPLSGLFAINGRLQKALAPLQRVFEILDAPTEDQLHPIKDIGERTYRQGNITFENVSFGYDRSRQVISDLSLSIQAGSTVGLAGVSGAGKTTFVNLLAGIYKPDRGRICFGGIDSNEIQSSKIRQNVCIVTQEIFLFNATVYENLSCGLKRIPKDRIVEAAELSGAHEFIDRLPQGYDSIIGVRGFKLSGGEKARLSIARAILRDPPILVLDEATAFMDSNTEASIRLATQNLFRDKTIIIIAHRLASLIDCREIFVFNGGTIEQQGAHSQLVSVPGLYQELFLKQARDNNGITPDMTPPRCQMGQQLNRESL